MARNVKKKSFEKWGEKLEIWGESVEKWGELVSFRGKLTRRSWKCSNSFRRSAPNEKGQLLDFKEVHRLGMNLDKIVDPYEPARKKREKGENKRVTDKTSTKLIDWITINNQTMNNDYHHQNTKLDWLCLVVGWTVLEKICSTNLKCRSSLLHGWKW